MVAKARMVGDWTIYNEGLQQLMTDGLFVWLLCMPNLAFVSGVFELAFV